jgi:hypothetical protein
LVYSLLYFKEDLMKKLLVVLLALTVIGIFAFAQDAAPAAAAPVVVVNEWGRSVFAFGNQDNGNGSGYQAGLGVSWGSNPRIGLNIQAHTDTVGFSITPSADNGVFGLTDQNKAWVIPVPGLTFEAGINLETDTWRGASDFGSDDWIRYPGVAVGGNSSTFARLGEGGYMTDLNYNKDGIGAWFAIQNGSSTAPAATPWAATNSLAATDIGKAIQAGAAYTITGIGTIKAQYLGDNVSGTKILGNPGGSAIINAAFNLSAVKGLYEEIGILYPTTDVGYSIGIADDLSYTMAALTVHARVEVVSYDGNAGLASDMGLSGGVGVDYDMGNGVGVGADVQYVNQAQENGGAVATPTAALTGVAVDIKKSFSNGFIGIGFQYSSIGWAGTDFTATNAYSHWAIPIVISESF